MELDATLDVNDQHAMACFVGKMAELLSYVAEFKAMPKPTLCKKKRKSGDYYTVQYREGEKVRCFAYKPDNPEHAVLGDPDRRRFLRRSISELKAFFRKSKKILEYYGLTEFILQQKAEKFRCDNSINSHVQQEFDRLRQRSEAQPNTYHEENMTIVTKRGEKVRSQGEKFIADQLYAAKVDYIYEPRLTLPDDSVLYPDFAVLDKKNDKITYLEYNGMMSEKEYRARWELKREQYARNNFIIGDQLFVIYHQPGRRREHKRIRRLLACLFL